MPSSGPRSNDAVVVAIVIHVARKHHADALEKSYCVPFMPGGEVDAMDRVDAIEQAAAVPTRSALSKYPPGWISCTLIVAWREAFEAVFAGSIRRRRGNQVPIGIEQLDHDACEQQIRMVEVAVLIEIDVHAAGDRGGKLLAEVVLDGVEIGDDVDAREDAVHARHIVLRAAGGADPLAAVEVTGRLMLANCVRARPQTGEMNTRRPHSWLSWQ